MQLSEKIELPAQTISRYEREENKIYLEHLTLIATGLQTPISWFLIDEKQTYSIETSNNVAEIISEFSVLNSILLSQIRHIKQFFTFHLKPLDIMLFFCI